MEEEIIKKAYPGIFGSIAKVGMRILFHLPNKACLGMVLALEKQKDHAYYAPRGLLEVSGYPKEVKLAYDLMNCFGEDILNLHPARS